MKSDSRGGTFSRLLCLLLIAGWSLLSLASPEGEIVLGEDGSIRGSFYCGGPERQPTVFRLGLPPGAPVKMWREGEVLRGLWVKDGIQYTETVCLSSVKPGAPGSQEKPSPVLLIQIQGQNTNSQYTEAFAELVLEWKGAREQLELKEGLIWRVHAEERLRVGALDIPGSGIKVSRGEVLRFSGNMPPSEKGAMILKIPLERLEDKASTESLFDLDFSEELQKIVRREKLTNSDPRKTTLLLSTEHPH